jgi:uncharacterized protein (DUF1800 family)
MPLDEVLDEGGGPSPSGGAFFRKPQFRRGDFNGDQIVDISDAVSTFGFLFSGGGPSGCLNAADANKDVALDLSDGIFTLNFLFSGGQVHPAPGPFECGVDPAANALPCASYGGCPNDLPLIFHVLNRITFGPTEELLTRIQTRADLLAYIEEQLAAPDDYNAAVHEPELYADIEALDIGYNPDGPTANGASERLKAMLLVTARRSRWQLLHVLGNFWNNHFHTQIEALRENYFQRGGRGGPAVRANVEQFNLADTDASGALSQAEWDAFRVLHPGAILWTQFRRELLQDGMVTLDEYLAQENVGFWKYAGPREQFGVSADMELREHRFFLRGGFGGFRSLIHGSAKSVAQVIYLNTFENTLAAPNENYAREFCELFTMGVDHVYTQRDIEELSKVFTGWTVEWVESAPYDPADVLFTDHPESRNFPINTREPAPFGFATRQFWDDDAYTWAFVFGQRRGQNDGHDWGRKDMFLPEYGGVDSLGNPVDPRAAVRIAANNTNRNPAAAMQEFELVLNTVVNLRDTAKFISTKLIQLLVTDDLSLLAKTHPMPADLAEAFDGVDLDHDGAIEVSEWEEPTFELPNGRPPEVFDRLDANADGSITPIEYQEPDLLLDAIDAWRSSGGNLREVVRTILFSDEFLSLSFYRAKVKTPLELIASAGRALNGSYNLQLLLLAMQDIRLAGMELFDFSDPTGESELGFDWMHTIGLLERLKYVNRAANAATPQELRLLWSPLEFLSRWGLDGEERAADFFSLLFFGQDILENQRSLALEAWRQQSDRNRRIPAMVAFFLSLPEFEQQ